MHERPIAPGAHHGQAAHGRETPRRAPKSSEHAATDAGSQHPRVGRRRGLDSRAIKPRCRCTLGKPVTRAHKLCAPAFWPAEPPAPTRQSRGDHGCGCGRGARQRDAASRRGLAEDHQRPSSSAVRQFTKRRVQTDPRERRRRQHEPDAAAPRDPNRARTAAARARWRRR